MKQILKKNLYFIVFVILLFPSHHIFAQFTWSEQSSGVSIPLVSASAIDIQNGWVCGYNGTVLRTSNAGTTWLNVSGNGIPASCQLVTIYGYSGTIAVTSGNVANETFVFRTSNGGANWTQVFMQTNGFINCIQSNFMEGDPAGGRWSLWKTTNDGVTWDSSGLYLSADVNDLGWSNSLYIDGNSIWFGTSNSRIYYSSNGGNAWQIQTTPELSIQTLWLRQPIGFGAGSGFIKTTNGGTNWVTSGGAGSGFWMSLSGVPQTGGTVVLARGNSIYLSTNEGASWNPVYTSSGNYRNVSILRSTNTSIWAVKDNGGISKSQTITSLIQISNEFPKAFSLLQNYPNPFNPNTNIEFSIPKSVFVKLAVYDMLGREVEILVNDQLNPGHYKANWDASKYTSGVYFYKLAAGNYIETKKMILIK
jgi:photosystem II stability/assembly factor-like uncharacterized protein